MRTVEDYHLHSSMRISNVEMHRLRDGAIDMMRRHFRERFVAFAVDKIRERQETEIKEDWSTEYHLDVYVIPPDELFGLIHREAERIARMMRV